MQLEPLMTFRGNLKPEAQPVGKGPYGTRQIFEVTDGSFEGERLKGDVLSCGGDWILIDDASVGHLDVRLTEQIYVLTEVAWWHWTDDADAGAPLGVGGQDLFNLPANNVDGNDLVTQNVGLKVKPRRNVEAGVAYEFPLTGFQDVIDDRFQAEVIFRY